MTLSRDRLRELREKFAIADIRGLFGTDAEVVAAFDDLIRRIEAEASDRRQRAIALLQSWLDGDCDAEEARSLADTLDALRPRDRWKPASEPPEDSRLVIVCDREGNISTARYDDRAWTGALDVAHWRELPEAP